MSVVKDMKFLKTTNGTSTTDNATCDASENTVEATTCDALVQKDDPIQTQTRPDYEVQLEVLHRLMPLFEGYCDLATEKLKPMIAATSECEYAIRDWQKHMQEMETAFKRRSSQRHCRRSRSRRSPNHSEPFHVALLCLRPLYQVLNKLFMYYMS